MVLYYITHIEDPMQIQAMFESAFSLPLSSDDKCHSEHISPSLAGVSHVSQDPHIVEAPHPYDKR